MLYVVLKERKIKMKFFRLILRSLVSYVPKLSSSSSPPVLKDEELFFFLEVSNGNQLSSLSQSLLVFWPYPLGHQCRVYIRQRCSSSCWAPAAGERKKKKMIDEVVYLYIFTTLATSDSLFLSLSPQNNNKKKSRSNISPISLLQMNEWGSDVLIGPVSF